MATAGHWQADCRLEVLKASLDLDSYRLYSTKNACENTQVFDRALELKGYGYMNYCISSKSRRGRNFISRLCLVRRQFEGGVNRN